jgi:hypothetical protein
MFCNKCGFELGESKFCSNCGSSRDGVTDPNLPPVSNPQKSRVSISEWGKSLPGSVKAILAAGVAAFLIFTMATLGVFENGDVAQCKKLVRENLKVPSSAKFIEATVTYDKAGDTGEKTISVEGAVEAQNSFGATVVAEFWCTNFNTDELELEYLTTK